MKKPTADRALDAGASSIPLEDRYLTIDDVAAIAQCSPDTVRRAIRRGALRAYRLAGLSGGPGRTYRLKLVDVRAWLERPPVVVEIDLAVLRERR